MPLGVVDRMGASTETDGELTRTLIDLSMRGLSQMLDVEGHFFCHRRFRSPGGAVNEGSSYRYTLITLLGVHRARAAGLRMTMDVDRVFRHAIDNLHAIDNVGDLGLLLWFLALEAPDEIKRVWAKADVAHSLEKFQDARAGMTTELSWFLAGLSHAGLAQSDKPEGLTELADRVFSLVSANFGGKGIFRHMAFTTLSGRLRGRMGSFADQVYPIYALSVYHRTCGQPDALRMALECAKSISRLQGTQGQWWWHYDAVTGRIAGRYPVFSVHQDGMAPMALFAIGAASGLDFTESVQKGLAWITGRNELGVDLVEVSEQMIWRNLHRKSYRMRLEEVRSLLGFEVSRRDPRDLSVLYECRQ